MSNLSEDVKKIEFVEKILPTLIVEHNEEFKDYEVVSCRGELNKSMDGFMSDIINVELTMEGPDDDEPKTHFIILKIMKGDKNFRELSKATLQFSNEIFIYKTVLPTFKKYLKDNNAKLFNPDEWWTPKVYFADFGLFPGLSDGVETILALENLKMSGYRMGPKIDLDEAHLRLMIKNIALYHSVPFAMRIRNDPKHKEMASKLSPFSFLSESGEELSSYGRLFRVGLERLFNLVEKDSRYQFNETFVSDVKRLKEKHFDRFMHLMETFLKKDDVFSIILHGDYVRNNVLFQYDEPTGFDNPKSIKMFDFQEVRFASPVIDLAFFMYMNIHYSIRDQLWDSLLKYYHDTLVESVTDILKCSKTDERLKPYSFENFLDHFAKHAFYGVPVCLHYVPWIACSEEECAQISHWFETDMNGEEFHKITQICGGEEVDKRIVSIVKHASEKGYMKVF
ncbi:CLUMA_CG017015, isoform A [Clunio marinus]|uniref:CLUMA_CG017015, isoform A n=1 Tax=Clunio marinus TaxID=568069 RepID=A0A1J1IUF3_9DIPT|nr:CLUMA_CG017015, isoform A [Clunio marinus]